MAASHSDAARLAARLDPRRVADLLHEAAAEEVMPRFRALAEPEVRRKAGGELVTVADEAVESRLSRGLADLLPGSGVVGEEAVAADPALLARVDDERPYWLIDPVDGTANFAAGRPLFVVMVALVAGLRTVMSWIHDPIGDRTAVAEVGAGAWLGDGRLSVAAPAEVSDLRGTLHTGRFGGPALDQKVQPLRPRLGAIRSLRCAGLEYLRLAGGEMHYALFTKLMPWDHVPGALLVREAGGLARLLDHGAYEAHVVEGAPLLVANDEATWGRLQSAIWPP